MPGPFCPALGIYAAIRLDPTAMVAHLDERALEEVRQINPKTYLVYIAFGLSLPFPGQSWYGYNVRPVGPCLRAADKKRCYDSDMCVPILPNEAHPTGRPPVRTNPTFPYDNCYHWAGMDLDVRVHAREEGFDGERAVRLPAGEWVDMTSLLSQDVGRARCAQLARDQGSPLTDPAQGSTECGVVHDLAAPSISFAGPPEGAREQETLREPSEVDIFEEPEDFEDPEYLPLVHLWVDLPANVKQEDIGNPIDLYNERYAIMSIIRNAHARNPDLPTLREYIALHQDPYIGGSDSESDVSETDSDCVSDEGASEHPRDDAPKRKRFRPLKLLRKLRRRVFTLPYIPVWP